MKDSKKVFGFQKQLKIGDKGEKFFLKCYKNRGAKKVKIRDYDITIDDEQKVELKSDQYRMDETENFFFERYGNDNNMTNGGPWSALDNNVKYFVYCFVYDKTFFWFETNKLCEFLDNEIENHKPKRIRNNGWASIGFAIPREKVQHLVIQQDTF